MPAGEQLDLALPTEHEQLFRAWKETPGGRHLLRYAYIVTAMLLRRIPADQLLSAKLVFELLRYLLPRLRARLARKGIAVDKVNGYALNNVFTAYLARHIMAHRTDWAGRFEMRETGKPRVLKQKTVTVVETTFAREA